MLAAADRACGAELDWYSNHLLREEVRGIVVKFESEQMQHLERVPDKE